jgi:N-acyl-D-aspartate/D-glutamate deacylase
VLDVKITGGQVIDGTGAPARRADVGLTGDRITSIGDLAAEPAGRTIDAAGRTVTPGFIDMHSHSDWRLWGNRRAESPTASTPAPCPGACSARRSPAHPAPLPAGERAG